VSKPQQLPSFFQSRYCVPSSSVKVDASIAPPSSAGHTSISSPTISNGPSGESAVATAMHWNVGSKFVVVGYMTNWPGPNCVTSGAQVLPGITHDGSSGSASSPSISHDVRSVEVATCTFSVLVLVA
jgi:hypothetical protein